MEICWVGNLDAVIVDGDTSCQIMLLPLTMAQTVNQCFAQGVIRHFKPFLALEAMVGNLSAEIEVLEEKSHPSVKQVKEIALCTLVVDKLILIVTQESCHPKPKLRILFDIVREKHHRAIGRIAVFQQIPFRQSVVNRRTHGTCWDSAALNAKPDAPSDMFLVQVGKRNTI